MSAAELCGRIIWSLNEDDLAEFRKLFKKKADSANSWMVNIADLDPETLDLTVRNPNAVEVRKAILREALKGGYERDQVIRNASRTGR